MRGSVQALDDIWHRSLEDLLETIEAAESAVSGPFVIKLQTSPEPIAMPANALPWFNRLHVYQRRDERSQQFQLRLGIIESTLEADAILTAVRERYPTATKESVDDADRSAIERVTRSALAADSAVSPSNSIVPVIPIAKPVSPRVVPARPSVDAGTSSAVDSATEPRKVEIDSTAKRARVTKAEEDKADRDLWNIDELLPTLAQPSAPRPERVPPRARASQPRTNHPRPATAPPRGPATPKAAVAPKLTAAPAAAAAPVVATATATATASTGTATGTATPTVSPAAKTKPGTPSIDSTQTVRALTSAELADSADSRWFVIQLAQAEQPIDADEVPNLDIFAEYRLYSLTDLERGHALYVLRVGFFSSEVAAQAVAGYLSAYFPGPTIKRVSIAERERFADKLIAPRKDSGALGRNTVIEVVSRPDLPQPRTDATVITGGEQSVDTATSLWSRLVGFRRFDTSPRNS